MSRVGRRGLSCGWILLLICGMLAGCARSPEEKRDRFLSKGKELLEKRDYGRALLEFRNAAQAMPKDAEPYYYAGLASFSSGDMQSAVLSFRKALDLNPNHREAKLRLSQMMIAGDDEIVKQAADNVRELMASGPATPEMLNTLAASEMRLGKPEEAIRSLEEALAKSPGELIASLLLARARWVKGDLKGAETALRQAVEAAPSRVDPRLALARFYQAQNRLPEAQQQIAHALQTNPNSAAVLRDHAAIQNALGHKDQAEQTFRRLAGLGEDKYKSIYALFLFAEGRRDEAVREFERLHNSDPQNRTIRTLLVTAYQAANRGADARRVLDAALEKNGTDFEALLQRGQMLTVAGDHAAAEGDLNKALKQRPDAGGVHYALARLHRARGAEPRYREALYNALQHEPGALFVRLELAGALIDAGSANAAIEVLDAAGTDKQALPVIAQRNWALWALGDMVQMRKGVDAALARTKSAEFLLQDGLLKLQAGNAAGARAALEQVLDRSARDTRALNALRQAYGMQRQGPMLVQKVKVYAAREPKSPAVQEFLGFTLWAAGDRTAARAAFESAKALEPERVSAALALVQLDTMDQKWDAAAAKLQELAAKRPGDSQIQLWLGTVESVRGNKGAALEHFRKAAERDPDNPQALNNYAYLLADYGKQPDQAMKFAQRAQELAPDNGSYSDTLGWIFYSKGLYGPAVQHLERAAKLGGGPVAKYHLAMAYVRAGDSARGKAVFAEALKANPNLPEAAAVRDLLQESTKGNP